MASQTPEGHEFRGDLAGAEALEPGSTTSSMKLGLKAREIKHRLQRRQLGMAHLLALQDPGDIQEQQRGSPGITLPAANVCRVAFCHLDPRDPLQGRQKGFWLSNQASARLMPMSRSM